MSVKTENGGDGGGGGGDLNRDDVCRDFLKNICNRGSRCKFYHPPDAVPESGPPEIHFCIDFQNRGCQRENCRYVHAVREDAERYKHSREVTLPLAKAIAAVSIGPTDQINGIPVCKEFQTGKCSRGAQRCRYWHVNVEEERDRRRRGLPPTGCPPPHGMPPMPMGGRGGPGGPWRGAGGGGAPYPNGNGGPYPGMRRPAPADFDPYDAKRARVDMAAADGARIAELERKNAELNKEVEGLKRELQREHERYEDLYALFRQQTSGGGTAPAPAYSGSTPSAGPYGQAQGQQQPIQWNMGASGAQWSG